MLAHGLARSTSGLFWSATTRGHVPYESRLELDRLWLADFDAEVTWIAAQPMWLSGLDDDVRRRHAPDLLLTKGRRVVVVDVKPAEFAALTEVRAVFEWTSRLCRARGWEYEVFTDADPVVLANIRALALGRRCAIPELTPSQAGVMGVFADAWCGRVGFDLPRHPPIDTGETRQKRSPPRRARSSCRLGIPTSLAGPAAATRVPDPRPRSERGPPLEYQLVTIHSNHDGSRDHDP